jgi:hypothetical protein
MRRPLTLLAAIVLPLGLVPGWTGEERLALLKPGGTMIATRVALDPADPSRARVGRLRYLGGVELKSADPAFGGFSAMTVAGDAFTLLSDGGNVARFRMGGDWRPRDVAFSFLPSGPRTGWEKRDRDAESMALDPATGRRWVGFESANQIWRYSRDFTAAERMVKPGLMRRWRSGGGIESFTRLADGRFVAISEQAPPGRTDREGIVWPGDPTRTRPSVRFSYQASPGYDPSDMTQLPDGRLLVLERALQLPFDWYARLTVVDPRALRPGAVVRGRTIARLAPPLLTDNFEGVAATREGGRTIVWLVSDDNEMLLQRTLLMKFALE